VRKRQKNIAVSGIFPHPNHAINHSPQFCQRTQPSNRRIAGMIQKNWKGGIKRTRRFVRVQSTRNGSSMS
jgi:hypothetical protein